MKRQLQKISFTFTIISFALCISTNAQIVYSNINPDTTICSTSPCASSFNLDLNNDGINDYLLSCNHTAPQCNGFMSPRSSVTISAFNSNTLAIATYPLAMNLDEVISCVLTWSASGTLRFVSAGFGGGVCILSSGNWANSSDHYLGVKLVVGATSYYGWVSMQVSVNASTATCTIHDYAYNSTANQSIFAGQTGAILPLNFLSFSAIIKGNNTELTWSTANELNNKGFDVERSNDGRNYIKIGFVNGKGNMPSVSNYHFKDPDAGNPHNYYRLRQVDYDDKYTYSAVIQIHSKNNGAGELGITPNPVSGFTYITFSLRGLQKVQLKVFDINGRLVSIIADKIFEKGKHQLTWNKGGLKEGIYFLKIESAELAKTEKMIISK